MAKRTITPAKIAAVVSSVTLFALYVMAQSGFQVLPGSKSGRVVSEDRVDALNAQKNMPATAPQEKVQPSPILMSGSKVLVPAISDPAVLPPASQQPPPPRLLPGSKGGIINLNPAPPATSPASKPAPNSGTMIYGDGHVDFRLLPGSKSAARVIDAPVLSGDGHETFARPATQP